MNKKTVKDVDVKGKRVLARVDFNVPQDEHGHITDDNRIVAALPTIKYLIEQGAKTILVSHLGRPKGVTPKYTLEPVSVRLEELLKQPVELLNDCVGDEVRDFVEKMQPGDVVLLENVRFHPEEEKNDAGFAAQLANNADLFVNDAFGTAHRAHASTVGIIAYLPQAAAGLLMEKELQYLGKAITAPERPCVAILGGAKVSDKIDVIQNMLRIVDKLLIGGAMAYTFLKAKGEGTGKSLVEADKVDLAKTLMAEAGDKLVLPTDHAISPEFKGGGEPVYSATIPDGQMALDIGPETMATYSAILSTAKTIIWNGPMGVFEQPPFDRGTVAVAKAVAESGGTSIVGGGDSEKAVKVAGVADRMSHISTGGGASLEFLSGVELPGVAALTDK